MRGRWTSARALRCRGPLLALFALLLAGRVADAGVQRAAAAPPPGGPAAAAPGTAGATPGLRETEHRYRLSAAIRPLFFWVGAKNVGGARIVWREGEPGQRGYELLLGSDPGRAPRRINRWGFVREDADASGGTVIGVMNRSEDDSLTQAQRRMAEEGQAGRFLFKMTRSRVTAGVARAESTTIYAPEDFNFRQLGELQRFVEASPAVPRVRTGELPPGTHPGLLFALADLVARSVAAARAPAAPPPLPWKAQYTFNAGLYDLLVTDWERVERARFGPHEHVKLVRMELQSRNLEKGTSERFTLACGTEGPLAHVPVFVRYQPKWWFKVEGVLDEGEPL